MREILFRGKRMDNGEWVDGWYQPETTIKHWDGRQETVGVTIAYKVEEGFLEDTLVDPSTVGQYTGLKDKNGKRIFEGDIVKAQDEILGSPFCDGITGKVVYDEAAYFIEPKDPMESQLLFNECAVYEVIGNIHDNPELLEDSE